MNKYEKFRYLSQAEKEKLAEKALKHKTKSLKHRLEIILGAKADEALLEFVFFDCKYDPDMED